MNVALSEQETCDHPVYATHVRGGEPIAVPTCQLCGAINWADLREQVEKIRREARSELAGPIAAYRAARQHLNDLLATEDVPHPRLDPTLGPQIQAAEAALTDAAAQVVEAADRAMLEVAAATHQHECACNRNWGGPCGPCTCEEPPVGVWRLTCGAGLVPPNQTYATKTAAEQVMRLHGGSCPGTHGVEFVPADPKEGAP